MKRDGEHRVLDARPERGDEGERQDQPREGEEDVGDAHQHAVDPAAEIAGGGADDEAEDRRGQRDQRDDVERRARAVDDAAPDVAAELVGAEQVPAGAGRQQPVLQRLGVRIVRGEQRRERRPSAPAATTMTRPSIASGLRAKLSQAR